MSKIKFLSNSEPEVIAAAERLSLDELFAQADALGRVEVGGITGRNTVEIKLNSAGSDYIIIREKGSDLKLNFHRAISRAKDLVEFYRSRGW
jgi:hypothetical protein